MHSSKQKLFPNTNKDMVTFAFNKWNPLWAKFTSYNLHVMVMLQAILKISYGKVPKTHCNDLRVQLRDEEPKRQHGASRFTQFRICIHHSCVTWARVAPPPEASWASVSLSPIPPPSSLATSTVVLHSSTNWIMYYSSSKSSGFEGKEDQAISSNWQ